MTNLFLKIVLSMIVRTVAVLIIAISVKYFLNALINPTLLATVFGSSAINYSQAVYATAIASLLSLV